MGLSVGDKTVSKFTVGNAPIGFGADERNLFRGKGRKTFSYTGGEQSFTVPTNGYYILECWGAEGGYSSKSGSVGGKGGYAKGKVYLTAGTVLKIYVGQKGCDSRQSLTDYAFNGGGRGGFSNYRSINFQNGGGGGGTDIRIGGNTLYHRLIVAGGGGGASANSSSTPIPMDGGGEEGNSPVASNKGTQTDGWQFGVGFSSNSNGSNSYYCANGGGGGWYGGGKNCSISNADYWDNTMWFAGGGSGFVWKGQSTVPSGYLVSKSYILSDTANIKGSEEMPNKAGTGTMIGNTGDGYVAITAFYGSKSEKITQAGVYHNEELGLISMSADGEHWVTIDDKNVGAWLDDIEDKLSYGGYFQFGNSHGFGVPLKSADLRKPGEHTLAYYKLKGDTADYMGNYASGGNSNITGSGLPSRQRVIELVSSDAGIMIPGGIANAIGSGDFTISFWLYATGIQSSSALVFGSWYDVSPYPGPNIWWRYNADVIIFRLDSNTYMSAKSTPSMFENKRRVHICWTRINGVNSGYINGKLECTMNSRIGTSNGNAGYIISRYGSSQSLARRSMGSRVICENIGRSVSKVRAYYDWTKKLYGILN